MRNEELPLMVSDRPVEVTIERLSGPLALSLVEPLIVEYGGWVAERLLADCGVRIGPAELARLHDHFLAEFDALTGPRGRILLARLDGVPAGVGFLKPVDATTAEIKRLYVRPEARGGGIGRALLVRLLADAAAEGYRTVRLETLSFMTSAHALYRSLGFTDVSMFPDSEAALAGLKGVSVFMALDVEPGTGAAAPEGERHTVSR